MEMLKNVLLVICMSLLIVMELVSIITHIIENKRNKNFWNDMDKLNEETKTEKNKINGGNK